MSDENTGPENLKPIENTKQSAADTSTPFWIFDTEYESIRDWVIWTEDHRREMLKLNPDTKLPRIFVRFEDFFKHAR